MVPFYVCRSQVEVRQRPFRYNAYRDEGVGVANNAFDVSAGGADDGADGVVRDSDTAGLSHTGVLLNGCRRRRW